MASDRVGKRGYLAGLLCEEVAFLKSTADATGTTVTGLIRAAVKLLLDLDQRGLLVIDLQPAHTGMSTRTLLNFPEAERRGLKEWSNGQGVKMVTTIHWAISLLRQHLQDYAGIGLVVVVAAGPKKLLYII